MAWIAHRYFGWLWLTASRMVLSKHSKRIGFALAANVISEELALYSVGTGMACIGDLSTQLAVNTQTSGNITDFTERDSCEKCTRNHTPAWQMSKLWQDSYPSVTDRCHNCERTHNPAWQTHVKTVTGLISQRDRCQNCDSTHIPAWQMSKLWQHSYPSICQISGRHPMSGDDSRTWSICQRIYIYIYIYICQLHGAGGAERAIRLSLSSTWCHVDAKWVQKYRTGL